MKKLFTLIAFVAFAMNSFASTDLSDFNSLGSSGWSYTLDGSTITYSGAWAGCGWWLATTADDGSYVGTDLSDYSTLTVTFTTATSMYVQLHVQYVEDGATSETITSTGITTTGDETVENELTVTLDSDLSSEVLQIYVQNGDASSSEVTIISAVLKTAEENEEEDGDQADCVDLYSDYIGDGLVLTGWNGTTLGVDALCGTQELIASGLGEAGNILLFTFTDIEEGWGFKLVEGHWGDAFVAINLEGSDDETDPFKAYDLEENGSQYALTLTDDIITAVTTGKWWGGEFIVQGEGLTLTKVQVMTADYYATGISNVTASEPATTSTAVYNLSGQRVSDSYKGLVIKNGKKVIVK